MTSHKKIKNVEEISSLDVFVTGGKGTALSEMLNIGIPVPPAFIISTEAFDDFLKKNGLNKKIKQTLEMVDINKISSIESASKQIQEGILSQELPTELTYEIHSHLNKLDTSLVAVRSSATLEDSSQSAWAGQLESYLGISKENLLYSIKKCWASLFTPRAIFYRLEKGLLEEEVSIAVIIQEMVTAEKAGIAFSANPVGHNTEEIFIEAAFGLGEAVVSGSVTPDNYVVDKNSLNIKKKSTGKQKKELILKQDGGSEWGQLDNKTNRQVLNKKSILELSQLVQKIENYYDHPCDVEWAEENGKLSIVQTRPITTTGGKSPQEYHKVMTRPQGLMDCECWDVGERKMLPKKFKELLYFDPLFIYTPGKAVAIYYNFTDPAQDPMPLTENLAKNVSLLKEQKRSFDKHCNSIRKLVRERSENYELLFNLISNVWPIITAANIIGGMDEEEVSKELRELCIKIREESDDILHPGLARLNQVISQQLDGEDTQGILLSEFLNNQIPTYGERSMRSNGWFFHQGRIIYDMKDYAKKKNIELIESSSAPSSILEGNTAHPGYRKGKAKLIFELSDLDQVKEGDILITPMTTPEMTPVLKKVSAIVTDEGGVTSHAAIISRELKTPAVIGTTNATSIIKNGDEIEVDAARGVVRII